MSRSIMHRMFKRKSPKLKPIKHFPTGIEVLHSSTSNTVDIVFVHGLTGDRERTWTYKDHPPWPKTLLPDELPTARILTFGYDADVVNFKSVVSENRITNHAKNLLASIAGLRDKDGTAERPIIFVCHSLGGLVCQDALFYASQQRVGTESHYQQIYNCTWGVLFLGTPQRGAGIAAWGKALARALGYVKQTNSDIFDALTRNSELLERIQDSFHTLIRTRAETTFPILITPFCEELPLPGIGAVVPRESASIPGYTTLSIRQNHIDMTKFADKKAPGFDLVCSELRRWIGFIHRSVPPLGPHGQEQAQVPAPVAYELPSTQPPTTSNPPPATYVPPPPTGNFSGNTFIGSNSRLRLGDNIKNAPRNIASREERGGEGGGNYSRNFIKGDGLDHHYGNNINYGGSGDA